MFQKFSIAIILIVLSFGFIFENNKQNETAIQQYYHQNLASYGRDLPEDTNALFVGSGKCANCHDNNDTLATALYDEDGNSVSIADDWVGSMMANSAKDPFWIAAVNQEVLLHPEHQQAIEDKCTSCHNPLGHFNAKHLGQEFYSLQEALNDPLALDGVSCVACHQIADPGESLPQFSGHIDYDTSDVIFGPFPDPVTGPMEIYSGYTPVQSYHISNSEVCASCHTLVTQSFSPEGEVLDHHFVEQATYHEWLNSRYNIYSDECQSCHLPSLNQWVTIASNVENLNQHKPFALHYLVGANSFMLELLKNNAAVLGVEATSEQLDTAIARTKRMLKEQSVELAVTPNHNEDGLAYEVLLTNKAGHKFPSGYPSRRAFLQFEILDSETLDTLWISGKIQSDYEVVGQNEDYEPHYNIITNEDEVQIYEMVMGDSNGDVTTVLTRGYDPIKDNRLTPLGFSTSHASYDTVKIAGNALLDPNFNMDEENNEGSGTDQITYAIGVIDAQFITVNVKLWYQSLPPKWMKELFSLDHAAIDSFENMYFEQKPIPELVREISILDTLVASNIQHQIELQPKIMSDNSFVQIENIQNNSIISVYDITGKKVLDDYRSEHSSYSFEIPAKGIFIIGVTVDNKIYNTKITNL